MNYVRAQIAAAGISTALQIAQQLGELVTYTQSTIPMQLYCVPGGTKGVDVRTWADTRSQTVPRTFWIPAQTSKTTYPITGASWSGGVATISAATSLVQNHQIAIAGILPVGFRGTFTITASTASTISFALASNPGVYVSGGTVAQNFPPFPSDEYGGVREGVFITDEYGDQYSIVHADNPDGVRAIYRLESLLTIVKRVGTV